MPNGQTNRNGLLSPYPLIPLTTCILKIWAIFLDIFSSKRHLILLSQICEKRFLLQIGLIIPNENVPEYLMQKTGTLVGKPCFKKC